MPRIGVPDRLDLEILTAAERAALYKVARLDPDTLDLICEFDTDLSDAEHRAALRAFNKLKRLQTLPERGKWWIWHAHRKPTLPPADYPGLGLSADVIAGSPRSTRDPQKVPVAVRVPVRVRRYLSRRSRDGESRRTIVLRACRDIDAYRRRTGNVPFRIAYNMMMPDAE
jgi:hypothetical protein